MTAGRPSISDRSLPRSGTVASAVLAPPDGHAMHGNRWWPALLTAVGRRPSDVGGRPFQTWWFGDARDKDAFAEVLRSGDPCVLRPFTVEDGGRRTVWDAALVPVPGSDPPTVVLACTDVTDAALARERLTEEARAHQDLIAGASHELRGPLAPLVTWAEVLRRMFESPSRAAESYDQVVRVLDSFDRQVGVLTHRLDDLFEIARLERGMALDRQTLELGRLADTIAEAIRESGRLAVRVERQPWDAGRVVADPARIARAMQALALDLWARSADARDIVLRASSAGAAPRVARFEVSLAASGPATASHPERPRDWRSPPLARQLARLVAEQHDGRTGVEGEDAPRRYWIEIPIVPA